MNLAIVVSQLLVASAFAKDCTDVSVVGDGTFCIKGPVCAGKDFYDGNENCPQIGDTAVDACRPSNPSYNKATGKCVAPVPADCLLLPTGAYGCVWNLSKVPPPTNPPAPPANCEKVSVVGDGTFCIAGPICSGKDDFDDKEKCPQVGDAAVDACRPSNPSYNKATGKCVAPVPAECRLLPTGAYGCVWDLTKLPPGNSTVPTPAPSTLAPTPTTKAPTPAPSTPAPTTKTPTPAPTTPAPTTKAPTSAPTTPAPTTTKPNNNQTQPTVAPGCTNVTVVGDAKFCIIGPICEGRVFDDGKENCPKAGDYAVDDCFSTTPSYEPKSEYCRAPVDSECRFQDSGEYKCVWPTSATKAVTLNAAVTSASAGGASAGVVAGVVAAVAAVGIAIVGTIMYKKRAKEAAEAEAAKPIEMSAGATPRSPEFRNV